MSNQSSIKILFLITGLATGGAEMMLLKLLRKLDRSRFSPTVISLKDLGELGHRIADLGIQVHVFDMNSDITLGLRFWRLTRLFRQLQPDIVQTWMYHADLLGGIAARLAGCRRVIWSIRQSNLSKTENKWSTLWVVKFCSILSHFIPVKILTCSVRAKDIHAAIGYAGVKFQVIPNGFELDRFMYDKTARDSVRAELGLAPGVPLVGLVARFDPQKNHLGFVKSAALIVSQQPDVHFLLAGAGVDLDNTEINDAVAVHGLQDHIHLLGRRDDIPRLMSSLDVLVSPSLGEAFPNVLGEAMACGVPCVVTDVGDSAEIVGANGRVVSSTDIEGLSNEVINVLHLPPSAKRELSRQARLRVADNYEIGHVVRQYEAFYQQVMANPCAV
jgi:glycosyltransferase involved in cell wall biosynthesis